MALQFGVFDHIEPVPGLDLEHIYAQRLMQIERLDAAGFYAYHLAEHHTPAVHSLAPSQNVFLAAVSQRTTRLRFGPCVYVLPLHHPVRLIEEIRRFPEKVIPLYYTDSREAHSIERHIEFGSTTCHESMGAMVATLAHAQSDSGLAPGGIEDDGCR